MANQPDPNAGPDPEQDPPETSPSTPDTPSTPHTPSTSDTSDTPSTSDTSHTPSTSDTSHTPGAQPAPDPVPREELLAGFAVGGTWDTRAPGPDLAAALAEAAGPEWRCKGASGEQLIGVLGKFAALESWAAAGKLGVIRALIRDDDPAFLGGSRHGDLPDVWDDALASEVALALAASVPSANKAMRSAWELGARLPEIGALLEAGVLDSSKARLVAEVFEELSDESAGRAEAMIVPELTEPPAKTYAQVERIATEIALIVDPHLGEKRRKAAEKHAARVTLFRERAGTAGLSGRDLPTDQALAANANVSARASQYKDSGVFGKATMDQLRAAAYLDLLNRIPAEERIAHGLLTEQTPADDQPGPDPQAGAAPDGGPRPGGDDCPCPECDGACLPDDDSPNDDNDLDDDSSDDQGDYDPGDGPGGDPGPDGGNSDGGGSGNGGGICPGGKPPSGGSGSRHEPTGGDNPGSGAGRHGSRVTDTDNEPPVNDAPAAGSAPQSRSPSPGAPGPRPVLQDLVFPLATLLGLADTPGEGHGLGALDPDLCRTLAATAAHSLHTTICLTVTNPDGIAIGHGCAKPGQPASPAPDHSVKNRGGPAPPLVALPGRINLTITAARLGELLRAPVGPPAGPAPPDPPAPHGWALAPRAAPDTRATPDTPVAPPPPGDPDWCRTWTLTLPDGRELTARIEPMPTFECDHRNESHGYQPNGKLRHLVQVRDHTCTFPACNRHARDSDFEHALPYDQGGRTCACNAGARSRQCHQVKQAPGWKVTQPKPGWHQWQTPRGRTYTQGPKKYPV